MEERHNMEENSWQPTQPVYPEPQQLEPPPPTFEYTPQPLPPLPPLPEPKKNRSGLFVALILVAIVVFIGSFVTGLMVARNRNTTPTLPPAIAGEDDSRLELAYTPEADRSTSGMEGGLTSVEIHEKLQRSNVAVQVHGGRNNAVVGEGSGIIIHENSAGTHTYVVTAAHVIEGHRNVTVELYNGEYFPAVIVGYDPRSDVGLLRIAETGLHAATFGDSAQLRVGEPVYAIGNPGGIQFMGSFTQGIVSAIDRSIRSRHAMVTIQHTAPISPGNSGGALVNALGQVVGINSQKIVGVEFEGMGFAVPSATVQEVVNNLIAQGYVPNRPKLGIRFLVATNTAAGSFVVRANELPAGSLIIASIDDDSDFVNSDIEPEDIITHVNGDPITRPDVLLQVVENGAVGDSLRLSIARVNRQNLSIETFEVTVRLVEDRGGATPEDEDERPWFQEDPFR